MSEALSNVMALAPRSARAPFSMPSFREHYRVIRRSAAVTGVVATAVMGFNWPDRAEIMLPSLLGLALAILLHDLVLPKASWRSMAVFDAVAYTGMLTLIGLPEPIAFVVMSQILIGFLTMPPRTALGMTGFLLLVGWAGYAGTEYLASHTYSSGERLLLVMAVSVMAMIPSCWAMLIAGGEMRAERMRVLELLEEKDELLAGKDRFLATVSHELRTPLTVVHGMAVLLESTDLDEIERRELAHTVVQESRDVAAIVEDLLVRARIDGGALIVRPQPLELTGLIHQMGRATGLEPEQIDQTEATALADPLRVKQVVRNLVSNAQRYGGPDIRIEISADSDEVTVAVCDSGPGVPPGTEDVIFQPYGRAHERPGMTDSVGLGLNVSRELARMMGGDVIYQRSADWTRFELTLPAHRPDEDPLS
jgi:signal transduction histidine kinase